MNNLLSIIIPVYKVEQYLAMRFKMNKLLYYIFMINYAIRGKNIRSWIIRY